MKVIFLITYNNFWERRAGESKDPGENLEPTETTFCGWFWDSNLGHDMWDNSSHHYMKLYNATFTLLIICLVYPPKFCLSIVFNFQWVVQSSQENVRTMRMLCESVEFTIIMIDLTCNNWFKINRNFKSYWKNFLLGLNNVIFGEMYFLLGLYHISSLQLINFKNVN